MDSETRKDHVNLRTLFMRLQEQMIARLRANRAILKHSTSSGDALELNWRGMLEDYLPARYQVSDGFVVDATGCISQQIDVIIFDCQYSPLLFNQDGTRYVPAESVYAVFEVKPELDKDNVTYAAEKASSVRTLRRTSAPIPHAGGTYQPKAPFDIIAGILTLTSSWSPPLGPPLEQSLAALPWQSRLNLGCALEGGSFEVVYKVGKVSIVERSKQESALVFFFVRLLAALQLLGTAPAIDFAQYSKNL